MLEIEIVESNIIENGVEVLARAWGDGAQIGFGKDGSIDIERFRIFNPPILVPDNSGVVVEVIPADSAINSPEITLNYREDPEEAILQSLEQIISIIKKSGENIVLGKTGNTTSTFYPAGGDSTIDGYLGEVISTGHPNWNAIHDDTSASEVVESEIQNYINWFSSGHRIRRGLTYFDTSGISGSDTINSATYSLYCFEKGDTCAPAAQSYLTVVQVQGQNITSDTALTNTDFPLVGDAVDDPTEGVSSRITYTALSASGYNDFTLNATGRGWIARSGEAKPSGATNGVTYLGLRSGWDVEDQPPTSGTTYARVYSSAAAGTTTDPKLVVEHSEGGAAVGYKNLLTLGAG